MKRHYPSLEFDEVPTVTKPQHKERFIKRLTVKRKELGKAELSYAFYHYNLGDSAKVEVALGKDKATLARKAYSRYSRYKKGKNIVDYEDMIRGALNLLKRQVSVRPYQHLMVDELQDIDRPQKELLLQLALRMKSTVMVGDPLQSIYGWRHSLPRYWNDIEKALKPEQFELTRTFRIPRQAMALVNDLAARIDDDAPVLTSVVDGETPELIALVDQDAQHRWLAKEIKALLDNDVDTNQIAILGKTRQELSQIALALRARKISIVERYGPNGEDRHKTHLLALVQLTRLEQQRVGRSSKRLNREEQEQARSCMENLWLSKKTILLLKDRLAIKPKAILSVKSDSEYYTWVNNLSKALKKTAGLHVESAIQCLIDASKPVLKDRSKRHHKLLLRDLGDIKIKSRNCETLEDIEDNWFEPSLVENKGVQLMTCHSAKGQEWDYVLSLTY